VSEARATQFHDELDEQPGPEPLGLAPEPVEVRRNAGLAALVGAVASAVSIAYLARATSTGAVLDWTLFAVMGVLAVANLRSFVDARTPLLVADSQGVRIRLGRTWRGMPWGALARVEHAPRRGLLRDGRLVLVARNPERAVAELDPSGRRQTKLAERLYGAPFAVPIALSTRVTGAEGDLTAALARLAGHESMVCEILPEPEPEPAVEAEVEAEVETYDEYELEPQPDLEPDIETVADAEPEPKPDALAPELAAEPVEEPEDVLVAPEETADVDAREQGRRDPRPALARRLGTVSALLQRRRTERQDEAETETDAAHAEPETAPATTPPMVASATPSPLRGPGTAARAEVRHELTLGAAALAPTDDERGTRRELPEARELRRPGSVNLVEDTMVWGDRVRPIARAGSSVEPIVIDAYAVEPAEDPVIGPELAAARTRLGLSVDQLAERTRIRPHVIESIEVDDFAPCGGDFYARGHLRTLARVLGIDAAPLLTGYDDRYADAPISPRRVFEAELATGAHGSIRGTRGGPNWSVLVAAVMMVVLVWSIARLAINDPVELRGASPILNGSQGPDNRFQPVGDPVPVMLTAAGGGTHVLVLDGSGDKVFEGDLAFGESRTLRHVSTPVHVQSSDGSLEVSLDGKGVGTVGTEGQPAKNTFTVR
jgi:transcriptional regulator with XRE-family HTH domain